jgi:hypothetical protein
MLCSLPAGFLLGLFFNTEDGGDMFLKLKLKLICDRQSVESASLSWCQAPIWNL